MQITAAHCIHKSVDKVLYNNDIYYVTSMSKNDTKLRGAVFGENACAFD